MKTILCYGDSLTWGYDAEGPGRHAYEDRWPSVLQAKLDGTAQVIPEGLNGRTTAYDDWLSGADRNGARLLPALLTTHAPLDLVVILLGSNDMKPFVCGRAIGARQGMQRLVDIVRGHDYPLDAPPPSILLVAPPPLCATDDPDFAAMFDGGIAESAKLAPLYAQVAKETGCAFFDAGAVARTTALDGVHLDAQNTRAVGAALEPVVRDILES
ncbi:SGNH/GDSL hydrolase family protein [Chelativorans sp. M5D2P16]|uniref:SGNH/GDSL hydrolase family protein n=1 Tax=Chelativorans sp. M5D2P16 TaxID=3095678 RepID=UPI002ACAD6C2|nr:SGNH/GDSL hydrolase family protein [Chelativorans sp. M5D2P16]MDZ5697739.1 SGNH/GDSL hydrolase family protein [Chelativorans sp. M5D2P16]